MLVVVGVLPLAHEVHHYRPYPPVVVVVVLLMMMLLLLLLMMMMMVMHARCARRIPGRTAKDVAPPPPSRARPAEDLALPSSLDGVKGVEEGVLHHPGKGASKTVVGKGQW